MRAVIRDLFGFRSTRASRLLFSQVTELETLFHRAEELLVEVSRCVVHHNPHALFISIPFRTVHRGHIFELSYIEFLPILFVYNSECIEPRVWF